MRLAADTNVLVRAIVEDDPKQAKIAQAELKRAEVVAISSVALCEFVWVLAQGYKVPIAEIAASIRVLIASANVLAHRPAIEAGLAILEAGGDFADGVIAHDGAALGGETFVSFDKDAVKLQQRHGGNARLLA